MRDEPIECGEHGLQPATFVCRHLAASLQTRKPVGFFDSGDPDTPRPDAWCSACNEILESTGGQWSDESEAYAGITLICGACYDAARDLNMGYES